MAKIKVMSDESFAAKKRRDTILIVEDNLLNLKLFRDLLKAKGYDVVDTQNGDEAVGLVKEYHPDLIVMDIQLHGISGYDIIKELKSDRLYSNIPIVAVTAFAMREDEEKILASGCEAYISKPISIEHFLQTIKKHLKNEDQKT